MTKYLLFLLILLFRIQFAESVDRGSCVNTTEKCSGGCYWWDHFLHVCGKGCERYYCYPTGYGYFSWDFNSTSYPCPVGTIGPDFQNINCTDCGPGTYQDIEAQSECKVCPEGTYQTNNATSSCINCPSGSYNDMLGQTSSAACLPCSTEGYTGEGATTFYTDGGGTKICLLNLEMMPSSTPTEIPTSIPSTNPSRIPSTYPSIEPTLLPSQTPSLLPSTEPSINPSLQPSIFPSTVPSAFPSSLPSLTPSLVPSVNPSSNPSLQPSLLPSLGPSELPSQIPSLLPSTDPSSNPSLIPSIFPSLVPSTEPSSNPSLQPSLLPSLGPSELPSQIPSLLPSTDPSSNPSLIPSIFPSLVPSTDPSSNPSLQPSLLPSLGPSELPSQIPSLLPSRDPSVIPSTLPSSQPSILPSSEPSELPSPNPSSTPSTFPSLLPSRDPSSNPSLQPSILPSLTPSELPSGEPTVSSKPSTATANPSFQPSIIPSLEPSELPSLRPSLLQSMDPSSNPSLQPSILPSSVPSTEPSLHPTSLPSIFPSLVPSTDPTSHPTLQPSILPSLTSSELPSLRPILLPSTDPSSYPSLQLSILPSLTSSELPSLIPSLLQSTDSSSHPSLQLSILPSLTSSEQPSEIPSPDPSSQSSLVPSLLPSLNPSNFSTIPPSIVPSKAISVVPSVTSTYRTHFPSIIFDSISTIPSQVQIISTFSPSSGHMMFIPHANQCPVGYTGRGCNECCDISHWYLIDETTGHQFINVDCAISEIEENGEDDATIFQFWNFFRQGRHQCVQCPQNAIVVIIGFFIVVTIVILFLQNMSTRHFSFGLVYVALDYLQIVSFLNTTQVPWPKDVMQVLTFLSVFRLDNIFATPECILWVDYFGKWVSTMIFPVALFVFIYMTCMVIAYMKRWVQDQTDRQSLSHLHRFVSLMIITMYFLYMKLTMLAMEVFDCSGRDGDDDSSEKEYMTATNWECYVKGSKQMTLFPFGVLGVLVYGILFPGYLCNVILPNHNRRRAREDQILRIQNLGESRDTNPRCHNFRQRYACIYSMYKPEYYYWTLVILLKKFVLVVASIFLQVFPTLQLCFMAMVILIYSAMQYTCQPWMSGWDRKSIFEKYEFDVDRLAFEIRRSLQSNSTEILADGSERDLIYQRRESAKNMDPRFLWDYNRVDAILQTTTLMICMLGIVFGNLEKGTKEFAIMSDFTVGTIALSLAILVYILLSDMVFSRIPRRWRCFQKCRTKPE